MIRDAACDNILRRGRFLHLGLFRPDDSAVVKYPYVVPLTYGFDYDCENDAPVIYMHAGNSEKSTKLRAVKENPHVSFAVETDVQIVPSATMPCMLSTVRYFSVLGTGKIELLDFDDVRWGEIDWMSPPPAIHGLNVIMRQQTGKMAESKLLKKWDFDPLLFQYLVIFKLIITSYTHKDHAYDCKPLPPFPPDKSN
jgi:nitroimidazol reductase NimA-like FMN-containing flavoprotein (pyridoxamine 5'-phosphate oxidase superfamily)